MTVGRTTRYHRGMFLPCNLYISRSSDRLRKLPKFERRPHEHIIYKSYLSRCKDRILGQQICMLVLHRGRLKRQKLAIIRLDRGKVDDHEMLVGIAHAEIRSAPNDPKGNLGQPPSER